MTWTDALLAVAVAIGVAGTLVPVLPGSALVGAAVLVWALLTGTAVGWAVAVVAVGLLVAGIAVKYAVPERRLRQAGVPRRSLLAGVATGVVGFFVLPVVGLVVGFLLGVLAAEWQRLGSPAAAGRSTMLAARAVGLAAVLELAFALLAAATWATGVALT
ncbi:MAG: DUF456 domain-containing protein [Marmoricola sp.]